MNKTIHAADALGDCKVLGLAEEALQEIFPGDGFRVLPDRSKPVIWCEEEGAVTGFALYSVDGDDGFWWVDLVYVKPEQRRKGICTRLLGHLAALATTAGTKTIACEVAKKNEPMMRILKNFNFRRDSQYGHFLLFARSI